MIKPVNFVRDKTPDNLNIVNLMYQKEKERRKRQKRKKSSKSDKKSEKLDSSRKSSISARDKSTEKIITLENASSVPSGDYTVSFNETSDVQQSVQTSSTPSANKPDSVPSSSIHEHSLNSVKNGNSLISDISTAMASTPQPTETEIVTTLRQQSTESVIRVRSFSTDHKLKLKVVRVSCMPLSTHFRPEYQWPPGNFESCLVVTLCVLTG